ncbi:MAG: DUF2203 family protein [Chloroflexota bacterium]
MPDEFTLHEARAVLEAIRSFAPDDLRIPLTDADCMTLLEAGIEIKDRARGLVDFPTTINDQPAYWCWLAGEPEITWWHTRDSGFAGRTPITE